MTKQEKLQQDIHSAESQIARKLEYLPQLLTSDLSDEMKRSYLDGIEQTRTLLANWQAQLAK